jgi:hypothetical protein
MTFAMAKYLRKLRDFGPQPMRDDTVAGSLEFDQFLRFDVNDDTDVITNAGLAALAEHERDAANAD